VQLVAREFNLKSGAVTVTTGASSRQKRLRLNGVDLEDAERVVDRLLESTAPGSSRH